MSDTENGPARMISLKGRREIAEGWIAPTLLLDANLDLALVRPFWPQAELVANITIGAPHQRVTQVVDASFSKRRLLPGYGSNEQERARRAKNLRDLHARVAAIGRHYAPGRVLVVSQQDVETALKALARLPPNVEMEHHNNVAGKDIWRDVAALVVVGRTAPPPADVEKQAEALTGVAANRLPAGAWYPKAVVQRAIVGAAPLEAEADWHPDQTAEAVRWQICEGELVQIIGRARGVNRTADNPVQVLVLTEIPLPFAINATLRADDLNPNPAELMLAAGGIAFANPTDAAEAYPELWKTRAAAEKAMQRSRSQTFPNKEYIYGNVCDLPDWTYHRVGAGKRPATALVDPSWHPDPAAAITDVVGPLVWCRSAEPEPANGAGAAAPIPAEPAATPPLDFAGAGESRADPGSEPWQPSATIAAFETLFPHTAMAVPRHWRRVTDQKRAMPVSGSSLSDASVARLGCARTTGAVRIWRGRPGSVALNLLEVPTEKASTVSRAILEAAASEQVTLSSCNQLIHENSRISGSACQQQAHKSAKHRDKNSAASPLRHRTNFPSAPTSPPGARPAPGAEEAEIRIDPRTKVLFLL